MKKIQVLAVMLAVSAIAFGADELAKDTSFWTYAIGAILGAGIGISVITKIFNWALSFAKNKIGSENYTKYMSKIAEYMSKIAEGNEVLAVILNDLKDGKIDNAEEIIEDVKELFGKAGNTELNTDEVEKSVQSLKRKTGLGR